MLMFQGDFTASTMPSQDRILSNTTSATSITLRKHHCHVGSLFVLESPSSQSGFRRLADKQTLYLGSLGFTPPNACRTSS